MEGRPIRVLIAKPGLDGHDRGAKVVAYALRDAGMEVIYTGLRQDAERIVAAAVQEDVDAIGLSVLTGAHLALTRRIIGELKRAGRNGDIVIVVGGTIPAEDVAALLAMGVAAVFPTGTALSEITAGVHRAVEENRRA